MTDLTDEAVKALLDIVRTEGDAAPRIKSLARALLAARADVDVAVALALEEAVERLDLAEHDAEERDWRSGANAFAALAKAVRALAPASGVAKLAELRAERDTYREAYEDTKRLAREIDVAMHGEDGAAKQASLCDLVHPAQALAAEVDRLRDRERVDADLLLAAYKGMRVLHRVLDKSGLTAGAETANHIADQIVATHPEMPGRASLRAAQPAGMAGEGE